MKNFFKRFRYPLAISLVLASISIVYLNLTSTFTSTAISSSSISYLSNSTLYSNIQANLNRMYKSDSPYYVDNPSLVQREAVESVIQNPFFRVGLANSLYWNVFFKRAAWLDAYCVNRYTYCGPTKKCSCLQDPRVVNQLRMDYYHLFNAQDLYTYKTLNIAGCTGAARVFMDLAYKFPLGASVRYVTAVKYESNGLTPNHTYSYACQRQGDIWSNYLPKMDGHQVVAVQMANGRWRLLDTSRRDMSWARRASDNTMFEVDWANLVSTSYNRVDVIFPGMNPNSPVERYTVTSAGTDDVTTHQRLMNKYASGSVSSPYCKWP